MADISSRIALEALRNGVPNRDTVKQLGCSQPNVEARFADMLNEVENASNSPNNARGMLVSGGFGSGKSHLLAHLENQALERNFICSKVVISKQTPFYDLDRVFKSAMENGQMPCRSGRLIEELGQAMKPESEEYAAFFRWANDAASSELISPMFPASLIVHERSNDLELNSKIESFWAGDRLRVADLRGGLRAIGQFENFPFRAAKAAELPPQRLRFAIELIKGAGYNGWVVLLDEIELVGSYAILQRGRSYAELARWMGQAASETYPGLVVVGTVTDDFAPYVISPDGSKRDRDYIGARLDANAKLSHLSDRAEIGMNLLERECEPLTPPTDADVSATVEKLRELYTNAYGWNAPPIESDASGAGFQGRMRYKVRDAINRWDLLRLRPGSAPDTVSEEFTLDYAENRDLEREINEDA